jgi:hypothetical protein
LIVDELFGALRGIPRFPDAACRGHHRMFDAEDAPKAAIALAVETCQTRCPALSACAAWYTSLPRRERPFGVTAGIYRKPGSHERRPPQHDQPHP